MYDGRVRAAVFVLGLAACGFDHGQFAGSGLDGGGGGSGSDATGTPGIDGPTCAWSYTPTNFEPCALPAPGVLTVSSDETLDATTTSQPTSVITQSDGTSITVIHLSQLTVSPLATLTVTGTGIVFAVDGQVEINGTIVAVGGADDATQCASGRGLGGTDSQDDTGGGGGGGGGAGAEDGGAGGAGDGPQPGSAGVPGSHATSTLSPLRGGCPGGSGGRRGETGTAGVGGRGGGALQISTNDRIQIGGMLDAAGRGGAGAPSARYGGAGGGSGGAIFLEGPHVDLGFAARVCADGGSGGEGGGATVVGKGGQASPCSGLGRAQTSVTEGSFGGAGGRGGYMFSTSGESGQSGTESQETDSGGGGGGGGGGVGWIRIASPDFGNGGAVVTPAAMQ